MEHFYLDLFGQNHLETVSPQMSPKCLFELCREAKQSCISWFCASFISDLTPFLYYLEEYLSIRDHAVLIFACSVFVNPLMGLEEKIDCSLLLTTWHHKVTVG